jgi:hypothetical protein
MDVADKNFCSILTSYTPLEVTMAKKGFFPAAVLTLGVTLASVIGCASAPAEQQTYPTGTEMYPAVYGAISELHPKVKYADIDFYNNKYTVTGVKAYSLTTPISYDMILSLTPKGEVNISYGNLYEKSDYGWNKASSFGFHNPKSVGTRVAARMMEIARDPETLAKYQKDAMSDIKFVHRIMKGMTELAFQDFIDNYAKDVVFNLNGTVSNVTKVNETIGGQPYKYKLQFTQRVPKDASEKSGFGSTDAIYCTFYTNQDDLIRLSKTSVLSIKGKLVKAWQGSISDNVGFSLIDIL